MPTLIDHSNNDFVIWESGAIIQYLVGKYDKEHKISFADFDQNAIANQYLMFQMSGSSLHYFHATHIVVADIIFQVRAHTTGKQCGSRNTTVRRSPALSIDTPTKFSEFSVS